MGLPELISNFQVSLGCLLDAGQNRSCLFRIVKLISIDIVVCRLLFIKLMLPARKITPHTDSDVKLVPSSRPSHISDINIHDANLCKLNFYSVKFPTPRAVENLLRCFPNIDWLYPVKSAPLSLSYVYIIIYHPPPGYGGTFLSHTYPPRLPLPGNGIPLTSENHLFVYK